MVRSYPGRVAAMNVASSRARAGSFQVRMSSTASAPVMKKSSSRAGSSAEMLQGVHCVAGLTAVDLKARDGEVRVRGGGDRHQQMAELSRRQPVPFVGRVAGGHEHHLVEAELQAGLFGRQKVSHVDGVEGPTHDAQPQAPLSRRRQREILALRTLT